MWGLGNDGIQLKSVQEPRCAPDPRIRISAIKHGRFQGLTWRQYIRKIEGIISARYAYAVLPVRFDVDLPGAAPTERAKPDIAYVLIGLARAFDGKPGVYLV